MAKAHTGHLTGSDAVTSAVFRQFGITRVDGLDELLDTAAAFARTRPAAGDGVGIYAISGGTGAHMADMVSAAGLRIPPLTKETQRALHDGLIPDVPARLEPGRLRRPARRRRARPQDPRPARRRPERRPARRPDHGRGGPVQRAVHPRPRRRGEDDRQADLRDLGRAARHRRHVLLPAARRRPARVPHVRELRESRARLRRLLGVRGAVPLAVRGRADASRRRRPRRRAASSPVPRRARRSRSTRRSSSSRRTASRSSRDVLCDSATQAVQAAKSIGYPVVMKVSSPRSDAQERPRSRAGRGRDGARGPHGVRRAHAQGTARRREASADRRRARVRDGERRRRDGGRRRRTTTLFGPVVMVGLGGVFVEVLRDVTFRVPPFGRDEARRMVRELQGYPLLDGRTRPKPADVDALVDVIMKVQRLAMDLAGDVRRARHQPVGRAAAWCGRPRCPGGAT